MKTFVIGLVALWLLLSPAAALAVEPSGYIENKLTWTEDDGLYDFTKMRFDLQAKETGYAWVISAFGIYELASLSDEDGSLKLNRAYFELYPSWGKVTLGRQNIAWGNGYLFNLPDQFNAMDPLDPKGEKEGVDAISVKWNLNSTAMLEVVALPGDIFSESDYGFKGRVHVGLFDLNAFILKRYGIPPDPNGRIPLRVDRTAGVIEVKGELGENMPGVWLQAGWFRDEYLRTDRTVDYNGYVGGIDYTFAIGNGLYVLVEGMGNTQTDSSQIYFLTRYSPVGYITLALSGMRDSQTDADMLSFNLKYALNNNIEINGMYNIYPHGSRYFVSHSGDADYEREIVIGVKVDF